MNRPQNKSDFRIDNKSGELVPTRAATIVALTNQAHPLLFEELREYFALDHKNQQKAYKGRLNRMIERGLLLRDRQKRYVLPSKINLVVGKVLGHAKGFGFVIPEQGGDDLYLHPNQMRRVLHNDKVLAVVSRIDSRGRKEGKIVEVIVDADKEILGHYFVEGGVHFVDPDDARYGREIVINAKQTLNAKSGDIVAVEVVKHPIAHRHVVGKIVEILGKKTEPGMETDIALRKYEIPHRWPDSVNKQISKMRHDIEKVDYSSKKEPARKDIRDLPLVTIDGADARDFDDAVFAQQTANGWRLMVAIADVSHYVQPDSALDNEAYLRGTSVYFPHRVVPMLPEALSNGICSLMPNEDRNCLVCDMRFNANGELESYQFYPAVMHSSARLTYEEMAKIVVDKNKTSRDKHGKLCAHLDDLYRLYRCLLKQRAVRQTIDFEFPEPLFVFNDQQKIQRVERRERNQAHRLIEECMLAANVCAAKFLESKSKQGGIYRVHLGPDEERLSDLRAFLSGFGLSMGGQKEPGAEHYAQVLASLASQPQLAPLIQVVLLRSLKQAVYSTDTLGHFALNYDQYTHFTSPIRRYPDLVVHRLIKQLVGASADKAIGPKGESLSAICEHASTTERRAEEATRDVAQWLKTEFMQDKVGDEFDGTISGVKEFGLFVELGEFFVDGLVHVTLLGNDYFHYDPQHFQMTGERSGQTFRLGDAVRVQVVRADLETGKIDFSLVNDKANKNNTKNKPKKRRKKGKAKKQKHQR